MKDLSRNRCCRRRRAVRAAPSKRRKRTRDAVLSPSKPPRWSSYRSMTRNAAQSGGLLETDEAATPLATGCPVEAVVLIVPNRAPMSIGPTASGSIEVAAASRLAYPADGSIVSTSQVELGASGCTGQDRKTAHAHVESVSIFRGLLTADRLDVTV